MLQVISTVAENNIKLINDALQYITRHYGDNEYINLTILVVDEPHKHLNHTYKSRIVFSYNHTIIKKKKNKE